MPRNPIGLTGEDAEWAATFRNNLKYIMQEKNIRLGMIARKLNMSTNALRYQIHETRTSDELAQKIADALDCTMDDLLDEDGNPWNFGKSSEEIAELNELRKKEREEKLVQEQEVAD